MNTDSFSPQEKLLIIQTLNHRLIHNYDSKPLFEKKRNFNNTVKPVHTVIDKLTNQDQKLTKSECLILRGSIFEMKTIVSPEKWEVLNECYKRLSTK